jgi:glyoxylase-like metal-dependent hydrolase (beta-lactamase superfamily II)
MRQQKDDDIVFNRNFPLPPGKVEEAAPNVRRLLCNNPGPFTFTGTVSYIIGRDKVAIVDPGPDDEAHAKALLDAVKHETVTHIFVTHTHRDHSPNTRRIKQATGATVYAEGPHRVARAPYDGEPATTESGGDTDFMPDVRLKDGEVVEGDGFAIEAVATPGHAANHMAFALRGSSTLFAGDHVMGWSSTVVTPPGGSMVDYMASLDKLAARSETLYFPGHGPEINDAPAFVRATIAHRKAREASILRRLAKGPADIPTLVRAIYIGLDERLVRAAGSSVLAHLEDLHARGVVACDSDYTSRDATYRLA